MKGMSFDQVPVLEVDGEMLARQHAAGLAGKVEWEQATADMYGDNVNDLMTGKSFIRYWQLKLWINYRFNSFDLKRNESCFILEKGCRL